MYGLKRQDRENTRGCFIISDWELGSEMTTAVIPVDFLYPYAMLLELYCDA